MRSTRASAAIERLKRRTGEEGYSMVRRADGMFLLVRNRTDGPQEKLSEALEQDAFVAFVNSVGPQTPKRVSKFDLAFEKQLSARKPQDDN